MAIDRSYNRIPNPPSTVTGDLYAYLSRVAQEINGMPPFSWYSGNPTSNLTADVGTLIVNVASAATARHWVKIYGSSNTGWASVATA